MSRSRWAAIGAAVAVTLGAVGVGGYNLVEAEITSGDRNVFVPITPCRLMNTRASTQVGPRGTPIDSTPYVVLAHGFNGQCLIPADAVALSTNVTPVNATQNTDVTLWDSGPLPPSSNLNPRAGAGPNPNAVHIPLAPGGTFNVSNKFGTVDIIVDVNGYYAPHNHLDDIEAHLPVMDSTFQSSCLRDGSTLYGPCTPAISIGRADRHSVMLVADFGWRTAGSGHATWTGQCRLEQDGVEITGTEVRIGSNTDTSATSNEADRAGINHTIADDDLNNPGLTGVHEYRIACRQATGDVDFLDLQLSVMVVPERPGT